MTTLMPWTTSGWSSISIEYSPTSFKVPSGNLIELFSKSIPFSTMESVITLVQMDQYKLHNKETGAEIFKTRD